MADWAYRIDLHYSPPDRIDVLRLTRLEMRAGASAPIDLATAQAGTWVDIEDPFGVIIYRQILGAFLQGLVETTTLPLTGGTADDEKLQVHSSSGLPDIAHLVLPDLRPIQTVVLKSSLGDVTKPAGEMFRLELNRNAW